LFLGSAHALYSDLWSAALTAGQSIRAGVPQKKHDFTAMSDAELTAFFRGDFFEHRVPAATAQIPTHAAPSTSVRHSRLVIHHRLHPPVGRRFGSQHGGVSPRYGDHSQDDVQTTLDKIWVPATEQAEVKALVESTRAASVVPAP
jgi:hypothetical protein